MNPVLGAVLHFPKEAQHASRPRQAQIFDSRSTWQLWSRLQGSGSVPLSPRGLQYASRRHDKRDSRTRSGRTEVASSTADPPRYLPREAQHAPVHHNRRDSRIRRGYNWSCLQCIEAAPHPPERDYATPSGATTGVIRAHGVWLRGFPQSVESGLHLPERKSSPSSNRTSTALPREAAVSIRTPRLVHSRTRRGCSGVASRARDPCVTSTKEARFRIHHDGRDSSGRSCGSGVASRVMNSTVLPEGRTAGAQTPA